MEGRDRLTLLELSASQVGRRRWTRPIQRPVTALASTDLDEDGFGEVLVATWGGGQGGLHLVTPRVAR